MNRLEFLQRVRLSTIRGTMQKSLIPAWQ